MMVPVAPTFAEEASDEIHRNMIYREAAVSGQLAEAYTETFYQGIICKYGKYVGVKTSTSRRSGTGEWPIAVLSLEIGEGEWWWGKWSISSLQGQSCAKVLSPTSLTEKSLHRHCCLIMAEHTKGLGKAEK